MRLSLEEREALLRGDRYVKLVQVFPPRGDEHVENLLIVHLPKMTDEAFVLFEKFLEQQAGAQNGTTLHAELVARLAAFLAGQNASKNIAHFRVALGWLKEFNIGIATLKSSKKGCSRYSQAFWSTMRTGKRSPIK